MADPVSAQDAVLTCDQGEASSEEAPPHSTGIRQRAETGLSLALGS